MFGATGHEMYPKCFNGQRRHSSFNPCMNTESSLVAGYERGSSRDREVAAVYNNWC